MFENIVLDRRVPKDWNHVEKYPLRMAAQPDKRQAFALCKVSEVN